MTPAGSDDETLPCMSGDDSAVPPAKVQSEEQATPVEVVQQTATPDKDATLADTAQVGSN